MTKQTFIFIHDQDVILKYMEAKKFSNLSNFKYVFVGNRPVDKIENLDNVIIARNLPHNIENYPLFTSYTGWYVLWKNNLINSDYINLFEYDIILSPYFESVQDEVIKQKIDFIGYIPHPMASFQYIKNINWVKDIIPSIKKHYNVDMNRIIEQKLKENPNNLWSSTSNSTFSKNTFNEYMTWFEKLFEDLKNSNTAGHAHERSLSFFYLIKNKKVVIIPNELQHFQLDSHRTSGHNVDFNTAINYLIK